MARVINRLSPRFVMNAKPKGTPSPSGKHTTYFADGGNLFLVATASSDGLINRSWSFKYEIGGDSKEGRKGRRREMGLGPLYDIPLKRAREKATELRDLLRDGIDPLDQKLERKREQALVRSRAVTFRDDCESYQRLHEKGWSALHAKQWRTSVAQHVYPHLGHMMVADITSADVLHVITPLWTTMNVTAGRLLDRIGVVLDYSNALQHRTGDNPAATCRASLPKASKVAKITNFEAVPYQQIGEVMARLGEMKTPVATALRFLILCASRANEVLSCEWSEIDFKEKAWTIPAEKMKARREHRVPLSAAAIDILKTIPREGKGPFPIKNTQALRYMFSKVAGKATVHGCRATFRTWASEATAFPEKLAEAALAHQLGDDKSQQAYLRGTLFDKRRKLMDAWAAYCSKPAVVTDNVVPISKGNASA
jgi:integrase